MLIVCYHTLLGEGGLHRAVRLPYIRLILIYSCNSNINSVLLLYSICCSYDNHWIVRFISVEKKSCRAMRCDLTEWLRLVGDPPSSSASGSGSSGSSSSSSTVQRYSSVNVQNKRLALMALHAARDLGNSDFAREYRVLLR